MKINNRKLGLLHRLLLYLIPKKCVILVPAGMQDKCNNIRDTQPFPYTSKNSILITLIYSNVIFLLANSGYCSLSHVSILACISCTLQRFSSNTLPILEHLLIDHSFEHSFAQYPPHCIFCLLYIRCAVFYNLPFLN